MKHLHGWSITFQFGYNAVRRCECGAVQSLVFDHDLQVRVWVEGNFHEPKDKETPVAFILCNERGEFESVLKDIMHGNETIQDRVIHPIINDIESVTYLMKNERVPILLVGQWYENLLVRDPRLTKAINKYMTGE